MTLPRARALLLSPVRTLSCAPSRPPQPSRHLSHTPARRADDGIGPHGDGARPSGDAQWPLLKRRARDHPDGQDASLTDTSLGVDVAPPDQQLGQPPNDGDRHIHGIDVTLPEAKPDPRLMLILYGLSPSLKASDFYRLAPNDGVNWQHIIKKIQQQRNPTTLEPLGRYHISFATSSAAASYRDRLVRLHRLSRLRLQSPTGLWESCVPEFLKSARGDDPATELDAFTVAPASLPALDIDHRRISVTRPWTKTLQALARDLVEYGEKPPAVLLHVYPPSLTAQDVTRLIGQDGFARGCRWKVSAPHHLGPRDPPVQAAETHGADDPARHKPSLAYQDFDTLEKQRSRFVVLCASESEARRFHRQWNQRQVTREWAHGELRHVFHASIINW